jgi:ATP-binding protein involved in chromosome partitioning
MRLACPCAQCVEEMTGRPLLDPAAVPTEVRPLAVVLVGTYAIRVHWSDGHSTGLYTFEWLRARTGRGGPPA